MSETRVGSFWKIDRLVSVTILALFSLLAVGTVVYHFLEGWTWIKSFYFTACTLTTVGYGDVVPTTDTSRLFTAVFALAGVGIAFAALSILGTIYIHRTEELLKKVRDSSGK